MSVPASGPGGFADVAALLEGERLFRLTMENAGVGMVLSYPRDGHILRANAAACALLGRDEAAVLAASWQEFTHPDDLEVDRDLVAGLISGRRDSFRRRKRYVRPDGTTVWGDVTVSCIRDQQGTALATMAQIVDITAEMDAVQRLRDSEEQFRMLAENASDIVIRVGTDGILRWISPSVTQALGWTPTELVGTQPWHLVHPEDVDAAVASLAAAGDAAGDDGPTELEPLNLRMLAANGAYHWLSTRTRRVGQELIVSFRLVDAEFRARSALAESEARYRMLAENVMDMVIATDASAHVQWASPSVHAVLGYRPDELVGTSLRTLIHPDELEMLHGATGDILGGRADAYVVRYMTASGDARWMESTPRVVRDTAGTATGLVVAVRDVDEKVRTRQALAHEVDFDGLTGLARRSLALQRIRDLLETRDAGRTWALLCVGVDGMTSVNQGYTYSSGDRVLRAVADRLVLAAGAHDRVARVAGDEFVVILRDISSASEAAAAADRILDSVRGPIDIGGAVIDVSACVGIALTDGEDADELMRDATAAMRQASSRGTDRWEFLDGNVGVRTRDDLATQAALRRAIDEDRIVPWFMPVVDLGTGRTVGYEALVRWIDADGSVHLPDTFLGIAQRTGAIRAIDRAMLRQVLQAAGDTAHDISFGFNVSAASLASEAFAGDVFGLLDGSGVDPGRLHFEVTETALFHVTPGIKQTMTSLADRGIGWWVDDFGTGFSSISHLRELPISGLKLDKSFTDDVTHEDTRASRLALGLVGLAGGLGLSTVAEGIERAEQANVLAEQGWQMGQGYLYGQAAALLA
jgi:PAS domain S-box-containing protein/diguanylate cyclase (GGDEF)-like protein